MELWNTFRSVSFKSMWLDKRSLLLKSFGGLHSCTFQKQQVYRMYRDVICKFAELTSRSYMRGAWSFCYMLGSHSPLDCSPSDVSLGLMHVYKLMNSQHVRRSAGGKLYFILYNYIMGFLSLNCDRSGGHQHLVWINIWLSDYHVSWLFPSARWYKHIQQQ